MKNKKKAFTLIELMIVVAILGTLASIATPKFANLIRKAKESSTKGNLGSIRGALNIYYGSMEGELFPANLTQGLVNNNTQFMDQMPLTRTGYHSETTNEVTGAAVTENNGYWYYRQSDHIVLVSCLHTDTSAGEISSW